jgi:hypothetical protein
MTIHVELDPEAAARLLAEAQAQGVSLEKVAERLLQEALASRAVPRGILTIAEFHGMLRSLRAGSENLPNLPTESFARENFYEDRA